MVALEIKNLNKVYRNGHSAINNISLSIGSGDFFALLGPNGAGKSTLIGIVSGIITKTGGTVSVFGNDIDQQTEAAKSMIGIVPQEINFSQFETCLNIVINQSGFYGVERKVALVRAEHYLRQLGLWDKRHQCSRNLSGGMKRRLMIAKSLIHQPKMLILDEPTAGVDVELRRSMWHFLTQINQQGTTILLTTHYLEEAENLCKNIAIIDQGNIIMSNSMKNILEKLNREFFIIDLVKPIQQLPTIKGFRIKQIDSTTLEIETNKTKSLNHLFAEFSTNSIDISSMRNKSNRLEELFLNLVDKTQTRW